MAFEQCKTRTEKSLTICYDSAKVSAEIEDPVTGGRHYGQQLDSACLLPNSSARPMAARLIVIACRRRFMLHAWRWCGRPDLPRGEPGNSLPYSSAGRRDTWWPVRPVPRPGPHRSALWRPARPWGVRGSLATRVLNSTRKGTCSRAAALRTRLARHWPCPS
jgi:hypothetical protein